MLEGLTYRPKAGVLSYLDMDIDDEDSLPQRPTRRELGGVLDIGMIRLPWLSNFTDFAPWRSSRV